MGTKCDIIRDLAKASSCGMCSALGADPPRPVPAGCAPPLPPDAVCSIAGAANARMRLFASRASPARLVEAASARTVRQRAEANYLAIIRASDDALTAAYPAVAKAGVRWPDLELCLKTKGERRDAYFRRDDARRLGMNPTYPLGGALASHALWKVGAGKAPSPVPLAVDYVMNPDLFALVVLALLAVVLAVLVWAARRSGKRAAGPHRALAPAPQPQPQPQPLSDPKAKCRAYVDALERDGYDMGYYRTRCGLPPK